MAYFADLSPYAYFHEGRTPETLSVGWLSREHEFAAREPAKNLLDSLFQFCKVSVFQSRGLHPCEFCSELNWVTVAARDGLELNLGSAEIRVLSPDGFIFAAPTLIFHYVAVHNYKPPASFLMALESGNCRPPSHCYFRKLKELNLEWRPTLTAASGGLSSKMPLSDGVYMKFDGTVVWPDGTRIESSRFGS